MRTLAVLPIKSFGAAKQRLGGALGSGSRSALAQAMFSDVLSSLRRVRGLDAIAVITADVTAASAAQDESVIVLHDNAQAGQSAAARIGIDYAGSAGFDRVLLVPGDTPLLDPAEIDGLLERADEDASAVVIVPDRHETGTNALLLRPPGAIEPSFGPGSLERHVAAAESSGAGHRVELLRSLLHDVDTADDLRALAEVLAECRGLAPNTRGALRQLDRSNARGARAAVRI